MSKALFFIFVLAMLGWGLPVISGHAAVTPESVEPAAIAKWASSIIGYWLNLIEELIRHLKP